MAEEIPATFEIDSLDKLDRFEASLKMALAEENFFSRMGMTHALMGYVPSLVTLARQQLEQK